MSTVCDLMLYDKWYVRFEETLRNNDFLSNLIDSACLCLWSGNLYIWEFVFNVNLSMWMSTALWEPTFHTCVRKFHILLPNPTPKRSRVTLIWLLFQSVSNGNFTRCRMHILAICSLWICHWAFKIHRIINLLHVSANHAFTLGAFAN